MLTKRKIYYNMFLEKKPREKERKNGSKSNREKNKNINDRKTNKKKLSG